MISIIIRRLERGHSPFFPDRDHIHHILQRHKFTPIKALVNICGIATLLAVFGIVGEVYQFSEILMFLSFLVAFSIYHFLLKRMSQSRPLT